MGGNDVRAAGEIGGGARDPKDALHRAGRQLQGIDGAFQPGLVGLGEPVDGHRLGLAYAPYADLVWCETGKPDLEFARRFAEAIHAKFPGKLLAYNCSPSFNWKANLDDATIARFQVDLAAMGYKFQFITLAGFHSLNYGMFNLARGYAQRQMSAFVELQQAEFAAAGEGFTAVKHQREVGTGYFDSVTQVIQGGQSSTTALTGSTEEEQFHGESVVA